MSVKFTVTLRGQPLRRTYVSHYEFFRSPQTMFFLTDENGEVTVSNAPQGQIRVRVYAQNAVVRVLDGGLPIPMEVSQEFPVSNNDTININAAAEQVEHFDVMNRCLDVYDTVFRQFRPFNRAARRAFPFGRASTVEATRERLPRIEVSYPDRSVADLAWVEPASVGTGYPLMHIKAGNESAVSHELAHALHFALMSQTTRISVEAQYLGWLTSRITQGLPPFHNTKAATSPFVAWIECFGLFSERFFRFAKAHPNFTDAHLRMEFFRNQLTLSGSASVARLVNDDVVPDDLCKGDNVEGALFGAIFVDLARRIGLREAVGLFLDSADNNVTSFDDFRNLVLDESGEFADELGRVVNAWRL